ncbi:MAG: pantoate--beta-alanine ligase [Planctomycetota bacterium]
MRVANEIFELRQIRDLWIREGRSIGLVPTMGFLHEGHLSLVRESVRNCDRTVASIFVNPAQFGPEMDLDRYPQSFDRDCEILREEGVDLVFAPSPKMIYPEGFSTWIEVEDLVEHLDGASRPGYFRGIATVVTKLFNLVRPSSAYFGQKDIQQAIVIQRVARDLDLEVEVVIMPIIRESDGLAMSSRNHYLNPEQRQIAATLYRALMKAKELFDTGERSAAVLKAAAQAVIQSEPKLIIDYVEIVDDLSMQPIKELSGPAYLALACDLEGTRLIDNQKLTIRRQT